jgi:hypothetical protein
MALIEPAGLPPWLIDQTRTPLAMHDESKRITGDARRTRTVTIVPSMASISRLLNSAQAQIWSDWWSATAKGGAVAFMARAAALGAGAAPIEVILTKQPDLRYVPGGNAWMLSADAILMDVGTNNETMTFSITAGAYASANDAGFGGNITPFYVVWPNPPPSATGVQLTITSTHDYGIFRQGGSWFVVGSNPIIAFGSAGVSTTGATLGLAVPDHSDINATLQFHDGNGPFGPVYIEAV